MEKKLFTRMALSITNQCNQNCSWCFQGKWKHGEPKLMSIDVIEQLLQWKSWDDGEIPIIFLLGGEPTLHPDIIEIISMIARFNPTIRIALLTNLTCSTEMLMELINRNIIFFINIDQYEETNNHLNHDIIRRNIHILNAKTKQNFSYNISVTLSALDKNFSFLYSHVRAGMGKIFNLRIAPSCIGIDYNNNFQYKATNEYYLKISEIIDKCLEINPLLHFSSECATNGCMVSHELAEVLKKKGYSLRYICGEPEPNADILPDLSVHWCFAFERIPEMKINNVFEYPSYSSMILGLREKYNKFLSKLSPYCDYETCGHDECQGPCGALRYYYMKNNKTLT